VWFRQGHAGLQFVFRQDHQEELVFQPLREAINAVMEAAASAA
jgi:hypothetical protein